MQCEQWCSSVKEFTEIIPTAESISPGREKELLNETDALMKQLTQAQLNSLKELAGCIQNKDVKKLLSKTLQRLVHVHVHMCVFSAHCEMYEAKEVIRVGNGETRLRERYPHIQN